MIGIISELLAAFEWHLFKKYQSQRFAFTASRRKQLFTIYMMMYRFRTLFRIQRIIKCHNKCWKWHAINPHRSNQPIKYVYFNVKVVFIYRDISMVGFFIFATRTISNTTARKSILKLPSLVAKCGEYRLCLRNLQILYIFVLQTETPSLNFG